MKVIDPGHLYEVSSIDGDAVQNIVFVKREGKKYPGNIGTHSGTTSQELLRVLIDRAQYINNQIRCAETTAAVHLLRSTLLLYELRAKRVKGKVLDTELYGIEEDKTCITCGHILCTEDHPHTDTDTDTDTQTNIPIVANKSVLIT